MARMSSQLKELETFLDEGNPRAVATVFSENPKVAAAFLGIKEKQLPPYLKLLRSGNDELVDQAYMQLDESLKKRKHLLRQFLPEEQERLAAAQEKRDAKSAAIKQERNDHIKMAFNSAGRTLIDPFRGRLYSSFTNAIKTVTEANVAVLSSMGLSKVSRHVVELGVGLPAFAFMANMAATNIAEAALPAKPEPIEQTELAKRFSAKAEPLVLDIRKAAPKEDPFASILKSDYKMMPALKRHMERDPQAKEYVAWCLEAAKKSGIDGNLFANQMYKESFWFKPEVIDGTIKSPTGAIGIAQFMPGTANALGVDPLNPKEAIFKAAEHMSDLTKQYGDQHLAMVVYNGRDQALDFVQTELKLPKTPTITQWMDFMDERFEKLGDDAKHAWHVETRGYIRVISSDYWEQPVLRTALQLPKNVPIPIMRPQ